MMAREFKAPAFTVAVDFRAAGSTVGRADFTRGLLAFPMAGFTTANFMLTDFRTTNFTLMNTASGSTTMASTAASFLAASPQGRASLRSAARHASVADRSR
jgi:hypothetical protein